MEKRRTKRILRRLKVRFGELGFQHSGFTVDISPTGLFIATSHQPTIGSRLHLEVTLDATKLLYLEGVVARVATVPPELRQIVKAGFGIRLLTPAEVMGEMVPHLKSHIQINVSFPSREALADAYQREIKNGAMLVLANQSHPVNSIVALDVELPFANSRVQLEARIVQVTPKEKRYATALVFMDAATAQAALGALAQATI